MKLNPNPQVQLAIITPLVILTLFCASCAPIHTLAPIVESIPIPAPPTSNLSTPIPQTGAGNLAVPECVKGGVYFFEGTELNVALEESHDFILDQPGRRWIGKSHGLSSYDDETRTSCNTQNFELPFEYIDGITFDAGIDVWMAVSFGGLGRFDANGNFTTDTSLNAGEMRFGTKAMAIDEKGRVSIGTDNGR